MYIVVCTRSRPGHLVQEQCKKLATAAGIESLQSGSADDLQAREGFPFAEGCKPKNAVLR